MAVLSGGLAAEQEAAPNSLPNSQPSTRPDTPTDRRNSDWLIRNNQLIKNVIFSVWHHKELFRPGMLTEKPFFLQPASGNGFSSIAAFFGSFLNCTNHTGEVPPLSWATY
jgi:hypothetical protein